MRPYNPAEIKLFKKLDSPKKIQDFLNIKIKHNPARDGVECRSPREVLKFGKAHCMEGALLAAAILEFHGQKPQLLDLRSTAEDLDHVVALFKKDEYWGAISKTNHVVLRYREPIYKSVRELAMSYFHEYFLDNGKKTLREYSVPINLKFYHPSLTLPLKGREIKQNFVQFPLPGREGPGEGDTWRTTGKDLADLPVWLDNQKHFKILSSAQTKNLRKADKIEIKAGKLVEWKNKR